MLGDGSVIGDVDRTVLAELTGDLAIDAPTPRAPCARTRPSGWSAPLRIESELVELPGGVEALSLEAAVPPEGETMYIVDGEILAEPPEADVARRSRSSSASAPSAFRLSSRVPIGWRTVAGS